MPRGKRRKDDEQIPACIRPHMSVPGEVRCLGRCGKLFKSPDRVRIRICNKCKSVNADTYMKPEIPIEFPGMPGLDDLE